MTLAFTGDIAGEAVQKVVLGQPGKALRTSQAL
jgi:hypothetical protein